MPATTMRAGAAEASICSAPGLTPAPRSAPIPDAARWDRPHSPVDHGPAPPDGNASPTSRPSPRRCDTSRAPRLRRGEQLSGVLRAGLRQRAVADFVIRIVAERYRRPRAVQHERAFPPVAQRRVVAEQRPVATGHRQILLLHARCISMPRAMQCEYDRINDGPGYASASRNACRVCCGLASMAICAT